MGATESTGTGKWRLAGVPHRGWTCVGVEDLGQPAHTCEMCEVMVVRYVHTMEHPDHPEPLDVGCICAGHMEGDYEQPRERERELRNLAARRGRFPRLDGWRVSDTGSEWIRTRDGFRVVVFERGGAWSGLVEDRGTGRQVWARRRYRSPVEVKRAAFDVMLALARRAPARARELR